MSMGVHRKEFLVFLKIIFHLHINGRAQERNFNFVKKFFAWYLLYCTPIHVCILNIIILLQNSIHTNIRIIILVFVYEFM